MSSRARFALATCLLALLVALVYAPASDGDFIWDDHSLIETNELVHDGSVKAIFERPFWTSDWRSDVKAVYYRPLTTLSFRADWARAEGEPRVFHVTNVMLHLFATVALVLTMRRLGAGRRASLLGAGVWALLPRSTESVAWIAGRTDVLAGGLTFAAIAVWPWLTLRSVGARSAFASSKSASPPIEEAARAAGASALLLLALLAKETALSGVFAIAAGTTVRGLVARGPTERRASVVAKRLAVLLVPLGIYGALRTLAALPLAGKLTPLGASTRALTILESLGRYAEMTLDPWHPATSIGLLGHVDRARAAFGGVVLLIFIGGIVAAARTLRTLAGERGEREGPTTSEGDRAGDDAVESAVGVGVGVGLAASSLAPALHLVPLALGGGVVADRLLYLPLAGVVMTGAILASRTHARVQGALAAATLALAVSFVPRTRTRIRDYTDEIRFRVVAAEHASKGNTTAESGLAVALRAAAEIELACKLHESARGSLESTAQAGTPRHLRTLENLGGCFEALGDNAKAARVFRELLALRPDHARVHMEIGNLYMHELETEQARTWFEQALKLDPSLEPARYGLDVIPLVEREKARFRTDEVRASDPVGWARALVRVGRVREATATWSAIVGDPRAPEQAAREGLEFLLANADLATAQAAMEVWRGRGLKASIARDKLFVERLREQHRIDALRPRIEALASD